jgi:hypothetical protein
MAPATPTRTLAARVPVTIIDRIQDRADREERTLSATVRVALREYLERDEHPDGDRDAA